MCRWAAYIGPSIFIEEVVTRPGHSLVSQSVCANEAKTETVFQLETLARQVGEAQFMRFAAAFSDGKRLYAVRYASDKFAPTVYYRKSKRLGGYAVVSEPLEFGQKDWSAVLAGTFLEIENDQIMMSDLLPNRCY